MALIDAAFCPHPDLVENCNRVAAWVDATSEPAQWRQYSPGERPVWPGWDAASGLQWHGTMTSVVAAGNGNRSNGYYRGLASESQVVLIQTSDPDGHIRDQSIFRALRWIQDHGRQFGIRVVNLSVYGDAPPNRSPIDTLISALVNEGVVVVAAAGNDGVRRLAPPASAVDAITVGGVDDKGMFSSEEIELWHSNYGEAHGHTKPEVVAPSFRVAAPILPGSEEAATADAEYKFVEGTSFAAPIVASVACCMLEVSPELNPDTIKGLLMEAATPVPDAPEERQGAGVVNAGKAIALARGWK